MAKILLLLVALACAAPCVAQEKKKKDAPARPNFSGTWTFNPKKSDYYNNPDDPALQESLTVSHAEPELKVTRTFHRWNGEERTAELLYYTDGRGEKNAVVGRDKVTLSGTAETETKWKGARLVIRGRQRLQMLGDVRDVNFTEKWELSSDGQTLTRTISYDVLWETGGGPGDVQRASPSQTTGIEQDNVMSGRPTDRRVYNRAP